MRIPVGRMPGLAPGGSQRRLRPGWAGARRVSAVALMLGVLAAGAPTVADGHTILEPEAVQGFLRDITRLRVESREGATEEARLEALYTLGQAVHSLVELMNQDILAHGVGDLFAKMIVRRLREYGIHVELVEPTNRYAYDFAAFRHYLDRAPRGKRAADIRYRLISEAFYRTLRTDTPGMFHGDPEGLLAAVREEERFLRDFPDDPRTKEIWLFRATDYYRLSKFLSDPVKAKHYEGLARQALGEILTEDRGSAGARAAQGLLEQLGRGEETRHQPQ